MGEARRRDGIRPIAFIQARRVERAATRGFFEGRLTAREMQDVCGAILAAIAVSKCKAIA